MRMTQFARIGIRRLRAWAAPAAWCSASAALLVASAVMTVSALDLRYPPPLDAEAELSRTVVDRNGKLLRAFTIADGRWRLGADLDRTDPLLVRMLVAYEDKRFYRHNGIDPLATMRAAWQLAANGRIVSGGSTITMQLARLLEPRESRSLGAKLRQAVRAWQIERRLTKHQILERYLTLAPYGGNLEGVRAAALAYFGKSPQKLTMAQAALLIALPQLPEARRPDRNPQNATRARDRVLARMTEAGIISSFDATLGKNRPVRRLRHRLPALAPHLADDALKREPARAVHRLTLDRTMQAALETLARERAHATGPKLSVAILLADVETGDVLARVGSADYFSEARGGALDMSRAVRSPGSTLKPFIYGLAFEAGIARPETLIEDRPRNFKGYAPENFDRSFQGTVSTREALQLSLNVPAITLLEAVGPTRLTARFKRAGVTPRLPNDEHPGLAIGLGGVGMSLNDLVTLYTALPARGEAASLHDQRVTGETDRSRVLSAEASWYVADILSGTPPPADAAQSGIAFKTGTSYGYRDAWAVGFDGARVMGVWIGRPDGASVPGLTGRTAAAPLLFEAFARIGTERTPLPAVPRGTVLASNTDLPPGLRRLDRQSGFAPRKRRARAKPSITFPPDGAKVDLATGEAGRMQPLVLKVNGGAAPFNWFANGVPVIVKHRRRQSTWTPDGKGYSTLTVVDAEGRSDEVTVFLD